MATAQNLPNINLSSGGFIFEGGAMQNEYTVSAGNIAKAGVEKIVVDFNGIYAPDYYGSEYVLISADAIDSSLNIEDANADFVAKNLYDGYAIFKWAENQGNMCCLSHFRKFRSLRQSLQFSERLLFS